MNFAPYSPSPDEDRTSRSPKKSNPTQPSFSSYQAGNSASYAEQGLLNNGSSSSSSNGQTVRVNKYETTLPIRVDIEASLAYVLGPVTGLLLLILERQNDYVRFHAWQSSLVFSSLMFAQYRAYLDGASLERYEVPYFGLIASEYVDTE
ncbi:hypothetical protein MFLAVUS_004344 [Mucor flavus]|uniref:Uncharacterized protein n=1 Tax=Mucor flavus TaxID=439312 RepID=A0ABP9YVN8_9FUNG